MEKTVIPEPAVLTSGSAISPIDGRYYQQTRWLEIFSEKGLMKCRLIVEVEFLILLSAVVKIIRPMSRQEIRFLRGLYRNFSEESYLKIKEIEKKTNHDLNAVVRYLQSVLKGTSLEDLTEFVHFGLTSEDVNNTAFGLQLREGAQIMATSYRSVTVNLIRRLIEPHGVSPILARTHGQPASPTTIGWEMNVFVKRLEQVIDEFYRFELSVKFGGATGGHNALYAAYPEIDWRKYSAMFVDKLNRLDNQKGDRYVLAFRFNPYNTQIDNHDTYAQLFSIIKRGNTVLIDFARDMWDYISREVFLQIPVPGADGSSTMPNKVNPIDFENAEGNLGMANAMFEYFSAKLPISRLQRDLSDSTVIRNFGTAFAHTLIALKAINKGIGKLEFNKTQVLETLDKHWEVLAEPIQMILRRHGVKNSYDLLKELTRGKEISEQDLACFINQVCLENDLPAEVIEQLYALSPQNYVGNRNIEY